jgi:hypothetical protein
MCRSWRCVHCNDAFRLLQYLILLEWIENELDIEQTTSYSIQ